VANCIGRLRSSSGAVLDMTRTRPIRNRIQARRAKTVKFESGESSLASF